MQQKPLAMTVDLYILENKSKIFCYHCGSKKYYKKGRKAGKQCYLCLAYHRYFGENFYNLKYKYAGGNTPHRHLYKILNRRKINRYFFISTYDMSLIKIKPSISSHRVYPLYQS